MPSLRTFYPAIRLAVTCLILAIGLRTWLVMGLIEPVTVAGSSMVPALQGGDRLWIDRTAMLWRPPKRWDVVVARNPTDAAELCVKRVVGLPGESVALRGGDVLVDGAVVVKSIEEQLALRQKVHSEVLPPQRASDQRWQPDAATRWRSIDGAWHHPAQPNGTLDWLRYEHSHSEPITDDVAFNVGLTRRLNLVDEFMLSAELSVQGEGLLCLALDDGTSNVEIKLRLPEGELAVVEGRRRIFVARITFPSRERLMRGKVHIEFSNFDQQLLLVIDDRVELRRAWPQAKAAGTVRPMSIGAQGLDVELRNLTLYRDIYYSSHAVGAPPPLAAHWQLGPDEFFLLGDNSPVSLDSRLWGPIPGRLLVGKPLPP